MKDVKAALIYGLDDSEAQSGPMCEAVDPTPAPEPAWNTGSDLARYRPLDRQHDQASAGASQNSAGSDRRPLPALSSCIPNRSGASRDLVSLTSRRMFWSLMAVAFVMAVALGRIHLRFSTEDLETQHVLLQNMRRGLERKAGVLEHAGSACWDSSRLHEAVQKRSGGRFHEMQLASVSEAVIPHELRRKYLDDSGARNAVARVDKAARAAKGARAEVLMQLLEAGKAYAATR